MNPSTSPTNYSANSALSSMRSEQAAFRTAVEHRFDTPESDMLEVKRSLRGLAYMTTTVMGRLEDVESRVDRLSPKS